MGAKKTVSNYSIVRVALGVMTASEFIQIKSAAKEKGLSPTAYMRGVVFKAAGVTPTYERKSWDHARPKAKVS